MTDNPTDGHALVEIQMGAAAAPAPAVVVAPTLTDAAQRACEDTVRILAEAVAERGVAHLALTGGSGGVALAESLAPLIAAQSEPVRCGIHLWFGGHSPRYGRRAGVPSASSGRAAGRQWTG